MRALPCVVAAAPVAAGCDDRPTGGQLAAWRSEAQRANGAKIAAALATRAPIGPGWTLRVSGQVRERTTLSWKDLDAAASAHVLTVSPQNPADPTARVDFRGLPVSTLLERYTPDATATEITFVAHDAFRSSIALADARRFPVLLAVEADGKPIPRSSGGPVFLVFPHSDFPETRETYPDRYWCFYVTDVIVGTEPVRIDVAGQSVDAATLGALPPATLHVRVNYKVHWPAEPVTLHGVRLDALLAARGVTLPPGARVLVQGKAPIQRDPAEPLSFAAADLARCQVTLATQWGTDRAPITARLGGPVTLALSPECAAEYGDKYWITFVEKIEVVAP